jgi:hypothetical protein
VRRLVHQASGDNKLPEAFLMYPSDTGAMPQKIPGSGAEPQANRKLLGPGRTPSHAALRGRPFIMREDRPGSEDSRVAIGQTDSGRYLRVIYVRDPKPDSIFVITAYELDGKPLKAYRRRIGKK